jgi:hypothetical protein
VCRYRKQRTRSTKCLNDSYIAYSYIFKMMAEFKMAAKLISKSQLYFFQLFKSLFNLPLIIVFHGSVFCSKIQNGGLIQNGRNLVKNF